MIGTFYRLLFCFFLLLLHVCIFHHDLSFVALFFCVPFLLRVLMTILHGMMPVGLHFKRWLLLVLLLATLMQVKSGRDGIFFGPIWLKIVLLMPRISFRFLFY